MALKQIQGFSASSLYSMTRSLARLFLLHVSLYFILPLVLLIASVCYISPTICVKENTLIKGIKHLHESSLLLFCS
jgi:hypothetical protein